ncbi:MAG: DNA repair protein RadC [Spirochaetota bacterium]
MNREDIDKNPLTLLEADRPREQLIAHGPEHLSDRQLLAILIGWGTKGRGVNLLAAEVLKLFDRLNGRLNVNDLMSITGLGEAKSAIIAAALEFSRRRLCPDRRRISFPADAIPLINHFSDRRQEHFLTLSLNGAHEVLNIRVVSVGLVNRTIVHPREVFADPLTDRAAAIIAAHNHPSGRVEPSREDREITTRLKEAGETLGISLLDHIIFSVKEYYSFLEQGQL